MSWVPHITVASIIKKNNEYLFVEEYINDKKVLNQPAGHLEEDETLEEGCIRETLEETAYDVEVDYLVGIYQERKKNSLDMWLRFCFKCNILEEHVDRSLDKNILRKLWLPKKELTSSNFLYRSDMVLKCIEDYEKGVKYPKEILKNLLEK
ncbi:MAG: NUDIX hydrolase [Gammaproteobacteria bacterium]|nr:NUDIX hydrolase [Gammaproteobacteria bacterium]|tara:strand:- start:4224 stop:4676 length:453 start_codon:yes stop_codon:yes gene_type:complete